MSELLVSTMPGPRHRAPFQRHHGRHLLPPCGPHSPQRCRAGLAGGRQGPAGPVGERGGCAAKSACAPAPGAAVRLAA
eukprot:scaffold217129_cov25-Tisochrysis_lutea.AAC.1